MKKSKIFFAFSLIGCGEMSLGLIHYMISLGFRKVFLHDLEKTKIKSLEEKINELYPELQIIKNIYKESIDITLLACSGPASEIFLREPNNHIFLGKKRLVISLGRPSYNNMDSYQKFDDYLRSHHISLLFGFGLEPGLTEALAAYMINSAGENQVQDLAIYCGGVPQKAKPPLYYSLLFGKQLPYSNRNSLWKLNDQVINLPRFSRKDNIFIENIGLFEAYHDGLSPYFLKEKLIKNIPNIKQQTLRWPGFFDVIRTLTSLGLLSEEPISENSISPVTFIHNVLEKEGFLKRDYHDITLIYIVMKLKNDITKKFLLCAYYDSQTNLSGMSQLTCLTAAFSAKTLLEDFHHTPGIQISHSWFTKKRLTELKKIISHIQPNSISMMSL